MSEHEQGPLRHGLLKMGNLPSAPADPMPSISRRINRRRKVRYTVSGVAVAACATLVATTVVPALTGGTALAPAATSKPTSAPTPVETPAHPRPHLPAEGLPVGSQVKGVGFEDFVAGRQGPGYVVMSSGAMVVVSHRENGHGRPCLVAVSQFSDERPRFCLDRELAGEQFAQKTVDISLGGTTVNVLLVITGGGTYDVELVAHSGDQINREKVVGTKTSDDVRFHASFIGDEYGPAFGAVYAHGSAAEADEGIAAPNSKGHRSTLRASGNGFEDFVAGKQGVGYVVDGFAEPGVVVAHKLDGTGQPCLTVAKVAQPEHVCFTGWKPGERVQSTIRELDDGRVLVAGFAKLDVGRVYVVDRAGGKARHSIDTVATPTTQDLTFFAYAYDKSEADPVEVRLSE